MRRLWPLCAVSILLAATPSATFAQSAPDPTDQATASTDPDCTRVGMHILADDLNATRLVCRGPDGVTVVPAGPDAVETTSAPPTEAPMQFFPLND